MGNNGPDMTHGAIIVIMGATSWGVWQLATNGLRSLNEETSWADFLTESYAAPERFWDGT